MMVRLLNMYHIVQKSLFFLDRKAKDMLIKWIFNLLFSVFMKE